MIIGSDLNHVKVIACSGFLSVESFSDGDRTALLDKGEAYELISAITEAIENMDEVRPFVSAISLKDGKNYKMRSGKETGVLMETEDSPYTFVNLEGESWRSDGLWGFFEEETLMDVVSEV